MRSYEELKDTPEYQTWLTEDNESNIPPHGESGVQMRMRVLEALADLTQDTCIITHGGVIAIIMENLSQMKARTDTNGSRLREWDML